MLLSEIVRSGRKIKIGEIMGCTHFEGNETSKFVTYITCVFPNRSMRFVATGYDRKPALPRGRAVWRRRLYEVQQKRGYVVNIEKTKCDATLTRSQRANDECPGYFYRYFYFTP